MANRMHTMFEIVNKLNTFGYCHDLFNFLLLWVSVPASMAFPLNDWLHCLLIIITDYIVWIQKVHLNNMINTSAIFTQIIILIMHNSINL